MNGEFLEEEDLVSAELSLPSPRPPSMLSTAYAYLRELVALLLETVRFVLRGRIRFREALLQSYEVGNRSLVFVGATMGFIGMIMVLQACYQAQRLIGDFSIVGPGYAQLLVREFAPTIGAMMLATRVGAGIAAEIGSMTVTEQIDALRMCGAEPVEELIVPRFLACLLMVPALLVLGGLAAELSGIFAARLGFDVPYQTFFSLRLVTRGDLLVGLVKNYLYGVVIPVISVRAGLSARGGSEGVGTATTRAVIDTSLAIIILDFAVNLLLYPLYQR